MFAKWPALPVLLDSGFRLLLSVPVVHWVLLIQIGFYHRHLSSFQSSIEMHVFYKLQSLSSNWVSISRKLLVDCALTGPTLDPQFFANDRHSPMSLNLSHSYSVKLKREILKELVSTFHLKWFAFATSRFLIAIECAPMRSFRNQLHILSHSYCLRMPSLSALVERVLSLTPCSHHGW